MWGIAFRARQFAKGSLWLLPLIGAVLGAVLGSIAVDVQSGKLAGIWDYAPGTATSLLSAVVGSTAALTGFVVTVSVLVVQMATGTFSARYMRLWYRDGLLKATLAVIVGTLTFSFALLRRVSANYVPNLGVTAAGLFLMVGILFFLLFLDRFVHRLRPVAVAALVAKAGRRALEESPATTAPVAAVDHPGRTAGAAHHDGDGRRDPGGPRRGPACAGRDGTTAWSSCGRRSATSSRRGAC